MRWWAGLGIAGSLALLVGGCSAEAPGVLYGCSCQVVCDGVTSRWDTQICKQNQDIHAVADLANENCESVHDSSCGSVSCSCSDCQAIEDRENC